MAKDNNRDDSLHPRNISRRHFIKLAAATGLLAGCSPTQQPTTASTIEPTIKPTTVPIIEPSTEPIIEPTIGPTVEPTSTSLPTIAPRRQEIIKMYPNAPSKVVHTHHASVWDGETLAPEALRQMLDGSITALTGLNDATAAWAALFAPGERIVIKTNSHPGGSTHVPLVMAVVERLQAAGVPAEQILVFDRYSIELEGEGYPVNQDGPGVRCHGTDLNYVAGWTLMDTDIELSDLLLNCDALINMPILKAASGPGISFAMKNHYGTFDKPSSFHRPKFERAIAELNAFPPIKSRTRLIVGDVLTVDSRRDTAGYRMIGTGDSILMSFDPVAHDTIGLRLVSEALSAEGKSSEATISQAMPWLQAAAELEVGTNDPNHIELVEVTL